jgi:flagellar FliJ protein
MKKFQFSLSTLLQVRSQQEEIAHKNLLDSHLVLNKMNHQLIELFQELEKIQTQILQKQCNQFPADLSEYYLYLEMLKKKIARQKNLVDEAEVSLERRRKEVVRAMQRRKIIENLRDKKYSEWETTNFNSERSSLDELSTMRYSKSKPSIR